MLYIETDKEYDISYIDASSISTYSRCPAKYLFERVLGLKRMCSSSIAPDFGTCMHRALPLSYENTDLAFKEFYEAWKTYGYKDGDDKRNPLRAVAMISNFHKSRNPKVCPYDIIEFPGIVEATQEKISQYEIPFAIDIGADLIACGRIDLPIRWKSTNHIFACDYKTTQEISPRFFKCFENGAQAILYTIALAQLTGEDVKGMVIEAVRVSKVNAETQAGFIFISSIQMEWFLEYAKQLVEDLLESNRKKQWKKNLCMCSGYSLFGHPTSTCEYAMMCQNLNWQQNKGMFEETEPFHPFNIGIETEIAN